jgi:cell wall-associated NlpC family hydrolase
MKKIVLTSLGLVFLLSCASPPRFTPMTKPNQPDLESKIDKERMGRVIKSYLGVPYQKNGSSLFGIDCSGLVVEVYRRYGGLDLPHDVDKLYKMVKKVKRNELVYGDLVFFALDYAKHLDDNQVSHVGIYIDEGKFVHSSETKGVIISSLDDPYYDRRYIGARRVVP